jgi:hypothetical protein
MLAQDDDARHARQAIARSKVRFVDPEWTCVLCGQTWPKHTTVDAYQAHIAANAAHPGVECSASPPMQTRIDLTLPL